MDDSACVRYFREPAGPRHRQYEALRAVFVEQRSVVNVAEHFGYSYGTLRNLVGRFRRELAGGAPPFSLSPGAVPPRRMAKGRRSPRSRTSVPCRWRPVDG